MEQAIDIFIAQVTSRRYVQSWIEGYYYNPLFGDDPYMAAIATVPPHYAYIPSLIAGRRVSYPPPGEIGVRWSCDHAELHHPTPARLPIIIFG
jgi:hypothetical protein